MYQIVEGLDLRDREREKKKFSCSYLELQQVLERWLQQQVVVTDYIWLGSL